MIGPKTPEEIAKWYRVIDIEVCYNIWKGNDYAQDEIAHELAKLKAAAEPVDHPYYDHAIDRVRRIRFELPTDPHQVNLVDQAMQRYEETGEC